MILFKSFYNTRKHLQLGKFNNSLFIYRSFPGNWPVGHIHKIINKGAQKAPLFPLQHTQTGEAKNSSSLGVSQVGSNSITPSVPSEEVKPSLEAKSVFNCLDRYFKPYPKESSSMVPYVPSHSAKVIQEANEKGLLEFENTMEYANGGAERLTKNGRKFLAMLGSLEQPLKNLNINNTEGIYEVFLLKEHPETLILTARHTHLTVAEKAGADLYRVLGLLTSQKKDNTFKLADFQMDNANKAQYLITYQDYYFVSKEHLVLHEKGTAYMQNPDIYLNLKEHYKMKFANNSIFEPKIYRTQGVGLKDLENMIKLYDTEKLLEAETKVKSPNPLTAEVDKKKLAKKAAQMLENQQKQKEMSAQAKLNKKK